ncbi:nuclear transport factor 2 family protein [Cupriavidus numazuensis]|uniref:SnoaL-like domain-containing protein n=1 Tax=Cupriavidus numazuensis TaxID=221992 RepID=A0ABM8TR27_9BURK|nr:nuclear transport factor 2 family protein [Cupriavidus numazuensis]CAG2158608.1 hypothetical protein LMG26411_06076 [Cupriavidus numazuensis]
MPDPESIEAIRTLAYRYAQAVDRREFARLTALFTPDAKLSGPGFHLDGAQAIAEGMSALGNYNATQHHVHHQLVDVDGDTASGETYCIANHLYQDDGGVPRKLDWGIRYQDRYVRRQGEWRIAARTLLVDWTQDLPQKG